VLLGDALRGVERIARAHARDHPLHALRGVVEDGPRAGVVVAESPAAIGTTMRDVLKG